MKVKVLGAAGKVGDSGFLLKSDNTSLLLDYGIETNKEMTFPMHVRPREVNAILTSHSHLDHIGSEPLLYIGSKLPHYATRPTIQLSELLLYDLLKISGPKLPFTSEEVNELISYSKNIKYDEEFTIAGVKITFFNAGHIPGSSMIYVQGEKKVLYTGDINHIDTRLVKPASYDIPEVDLIITEGTYALADHKDRSEEETNFVNFSKEIIEGGGTLLVPAFAVGRAQEMAEIYEANNFSYETYMDGMALKVNRILQDNPEFIRDPETLNRALSRVTYIDGWGDRKKIVKRKASIISPAGMLSGGASSFYNEQVSRDENNGIAIVSYQVEGTPGRELLDNNYTWIRGKRVKVKAKVGRFDFSSHSGRSQLLKFFKNVKGSPRVLVIHGELESCKGLAEELNNIGLKATYPKLGDVIEI